MLTLSEGPKPLGAVSAAGVVVYCTVAEGERVQSPLVFGAVSHPDKELTPPPPSTTTSQRMGPAAVPTSLTEDER